jgi:hypothetical protein
MRANQIVLNVAVWWFSLTATLWVELPAVAQQSSGSGTEQVTADHAELQQLKGELKRIEARIDAIEAAQPGAPKAEVATRTGVSLTAQTTPAVDVAAPEKEAAKGPEAVKEAQEEGKDTMDAGMGGETIDIPLIPQMKIHGFGDVRAYLANQNLAVIGSSAGAPTLAAQGGNSTFYLGLMDLFITSKISEKFSYLAEIGFEADPSTNGVGVDLERAQMSFTPNDKFSLSVGRTHAMLGYYNTAFHHGTWFQTAIDRPRMFAFEDSGGPLPIHNVGVSMMGKVPSGKLGLHWLAEAGNGKQTYSLAAAITPANVLADHTGKSTNVGFFVRPEKFSGLQAGFDWYQASLVPVVSSLPGFGTPGFAFPDAVSYYRQNIFIAHAIYIQPHFEFMVEDAEIRDLPRGASQPLYTSGGYAQVSKAFGVLRPYVRYQWMNPNFRDPNNATVGRWVGPSAGVRWDINTFIALKGEYSHFDWRNFSVDPGGNQVFPILHKTIDQVGSQLTYTF